MLVEVGDFQRARLELAGEKKSTQIGKEALEYCVTLLILAGAHNHNGDFVKTLACYVELQQAAKQITNKQMGALILQFVNAKRLQALRQISQAEKEFRLFLEALEKAVGKRHYLYTVLDRDHADFLFENGLYEEAEKKYLDLETTYRSAYGGDGLGLADIYYNLSRSIARGRWRAPRPAAIRSATKSCPPGPCITPAPPTTKAGSMMQSPSRWPSWRSGSATR